MPNWKKLVVSGSDASLNSLTVNNAITASSFYGDGSGLTNVNATVSEQATVSDTFTSVTSKTVNHNFGTKNVIVSVYSSTDQLILPATVTTTDDNTVDITFDTATTGRVVVAKGGHIVSGSAFDSNALEGQAGSYYLDYNNFTNIPSGLVSGSSQLSGFISASGGFISGQLIVGTGNNSVSSSNLLFIDTANERVGVKTTSPQYPFHYVQDTGNALAVYEKQGGAAVFYEAQDTRAALGTVSSHPLLFAINSSEVSRINTSGVYEGDVSGSITGEFIPTAHIIPNANEAYDLGSPTNRFRDLYLSGSTLYLGDTKLSKDADGNLEVKDSNNTLKTLKVAQIEVGAGAKKVTLKVENDRLRFEDKDSGGDVNTYRININGLSSYTINHNLDENYPVVQVYDTNKNQVIPASITSSNADNVIISFDTSFSGTVVVKK